MMQMMNIMVRDVDLDGMMDIEDIDKSHIEDMEGIVATKDLMEDVVVTVVIMVVIMEGVVVIIEGAVGGMVVMVTVNL